MTYPLIKLYCKLKTANYLEQNKHNYSFMKYWTCLIAKRSHWDFIFVKIILLKSGICVLTLRKRLFCDAKQPLLVGKRATFGTQNNRFCNALIIRWLCDTCGCEKYLQTYGLFSVSEMRNGGLTV